MPTSAAALEAFGADLHEKRQIRDLGARLVGDVHDDAPGPCPDCSRAARCGVQGLACEAFAIFERAGGSTRWCRAPRQPSRTIYARLFG
jgi:hypothetical protein